MKRKSMKFTSASESAEDSVWSIEDIVDGPKYETINGKRKKYYKVRWSESYELATNIPPELIQIYEQRGKKQIRILGPLVESTNQASNMDHSEENNEKKQAPLTKAKFAVEIGEEIFLMSYNEVKSLYKNELLDYFEERARIERE